MKITRDTPLHVFCPVVWDGAPKKTLGWFYDRLPAAGIGDPVSHLSSEVKDLVNYHGRDVLFETQGNLFKLIDWDDFIEQLRERIADELADHEESIEEKLSDVLDELVDYAEMVALSESTSRYVEFKQKLKDILDSADPM